MDIFNILEMVGGLCLFLFGMSVMGQALEKSAGGKLRSLLSKMTSTKMTGFLTGLGITAIIQSSSATTVMVVGFVNSGLMTLKQAINVIMGANVGTTVTAWILSLSGISSDALWVRLLKPSSFTPILALIGTILYMFSKSEKVAVCQRVREFRRRGGNLQITEHIVRDVFQISGQKKDDPAFGVVKTAGGDHSDPAGRKTHCAQNRLLIRIQEHRVGRNIPLKAGVPKLCDPLPEERLFLIRHYWRMFSPEIFTVPVPMEALTVEVRISWNSPDRLTLSGVMMKI